MTVDLDNDGLKALVKGTPPSYDEFNNPLVKKAGHSYSDQYGWTTWSSLDKLTDDELWELYKICKKN
jgi:hypothetical protein